MAGTAAFGWHPLALPGTGVQLPIGQAVTRMLIVVGYVLVTEIAVAGIAFLLSVSTDSPLGAVGGAVGLMILSAHPRPGHRARILAGDPPVALAVRLAGRRATADHLGGMLEGASVCACYGIVLSRWRFRRFQRKDIVS